MAERESILQPLQTSILSSVYLSTKIPSGEFATKCCKNVPFNIAIFFCPSVCQLVKYGELLEGFVRNLIFKSVDTIHRNIVILFKNQTVHVTEYTVSQFQRYYFVKLFVIIVGIIRKLSYNKPTRCVIFFTSFRYHASTCFGPICSPSSGGQVYNVPMVRLLLLKRLLAELDK
jgi:hypothetical protein